MYIYLDESGDLGFTKKSSKHFVIAVLAITDPITLRRRLRKYRMKLRKKDKRIAEFKFNRASPKIRTEILEIINAENLSLGFVYLNKDRVYPRLHDKKRELYAYMTRRLMDKFLFEPDDSQITLIVDRLFARSGRDNFDTYIDRNIRKMFESLRKIEIKHISSEQDLCLQAVDFVCGAVSYKYRHNDSRYFDIIKKKFREKQELFSRVKSR